MNYLTSSGLTAVLSDLKTYIDNKDLNISEQIGIEPIKHDVLMEMKFQSKLVPGKFYRITDYTATINKTGYRSAGKQFDIIVLALSENSLAEDAWAEHHLDSVYDINVGQNQDKDLYFPNCNLSAWKIKYCVENERLHYNFGINNYSLYVTDTEYIRTPEKDSVFTGGNYSTHTACAFAVGNTQICYVPAGLLINNLGDYSQLPAFNLDGSYYNGSSIWPIHEGGKGIVYKMEDEWGNECPYDFKNIQILRNTAWVTENYDKLVANVSDSGLVKQDYYCYTFSYYDSSSEEKFMDLSFYDICSHNKIINQEGLTRIVMMGNDYSYNEFNNCTNVTLLGDGWGNKLYNINTTTTLGESDYNIYGINSNNEIKSGNIFDLLN